MSTKDEIITIADNLIREKGYNAFSFMVISKAIGIKTASIHYHFPAKSDLAVATIKMHGEKLDRYIKEQIGKAPDEKLESFFRIYSKIRSENKVCLVGSLATDFNTLDRKIRNALKTFSSKILDWVIEILEDGKQEGIFDYKVPSRTKALMIIANMLAIVQLSRLTNEDDFSAIKEGILSELKPR